MALATSRHGPRWLGWWWRLLAVGKEGVVVGFPTLMGWVGGAFGLNGGACGLNGGACGFHGGGCLLHNDHSLLSFCQRPPGIVALLSQSRTHRWGGAGGTVALLQDPSSSQKVTAKQPPDVAAQRPGVNKQLYNVVFCTIPQERRLRLYSTDGHSAGQSARGGSSDGSARGALLEADTPRHPPPSAAAGSSPFPRWERRTGGHAEYVYRAGGGWGGYVLPAPHSLRHTGSAPALGRRGESAWSSANAGGRGSRLLSSCPRPCPSAAHER